MHSSFAIDARQSDKILVICITDGMISKRDRHAIYEEFEANECKKEDKN